MRTIRECRNKRSPKLNSQRMLYPIKLTPSLERPMPLSLTVSYKNRSCIIVYEKLKEHDRLLKEHDRLLGEHDLKLKEQGDAINLLKAISGGSQKDG